MAHPLGDMTKPKQLAELLKQFAREEAKREEETVATIRTATEPKLPRGTRSRRTNPRTTRTRP